VVGFGPSIAGLAALVYTTIQAPTHGWSSAITLTGFGAAVVVLAAFVASERRVAEPMLDIGLFRHVRFSAASFSITVAFFGLFGFIFLITQYFQLVDGYSPLSAGVHTLPFALGVGAAAPVEPLLARRGGTIADRPRRPGADGAGFLIASTLGGHTAYLGPVIVSMVMIAVGLGLTTAPSTDAILAVLPPAKAGVGLRGQRRHPRARRNLRRGGHRRRICICLRPAPGAAPSPPTARLRPRSREKLARRRSPHRRQRTRNRKHRDR
jgi:hypothetical protein